MHNSEDHAISEILRTEPLVWLIFNSMPITANEQIRLNLLAKNSFKNDKS